MSGDVLADIFGIPPDKAAALRMLAHDEPAILAHMKYEGDLVEVPVLVGREYRVATFIAERRSDRLRARFVDMVGQRLMEPS